MPLGVVRLDGPHIQRLTRQTLPNGLRLGKVWIDTNGVLNIRWEALGGILTNGCSCTRGLFGAIRRCYWDGLSVMSGLRASVAGGHSVAFRPQYG